MNEQQLWRIEAQLKRMNGNDLQGLKEGFNKKIDYIFEKACSDLDGLKPKTKVQSDNSIAGMMRLQAEAMGNINSLCNRPLRVARPPFSFLGY